MLYKVSVNANTVRIAFLLQRFTMQNEKFHKINHFDKRM